MNCEPGDRAFIVRAGPLSQHLIGRVITVHRLDHKVDIPVWIYTPLLRQSDGRAIHFAEDRCLRPIRDPGDDAIDETLLWLHVTPPFARKEPA